MEKSETRDALQRAADHAVDYLNTLDHASVAATIAAEELRQRLARPLPETGVSAPVVVDDLVRDVQGGLLGSAGGRFYGWVIGGGLPAAVAADWLTSVWDQNAGLYACGPAAAIVEEVCGTWLKELLGVPDAASFSLVTGCQMAHATCFAAAREALLSRTGWDVNRDGLFGAQRLRVLTSQDVHGTCLRSVKLLGLGTANVEILESHGGPYLQPDVLRAALSTSPERPVIVVLQAGDVNCGAFDPFAQLVPLAHEHGAWVHVDGAMGLWAHADPSRRHLLAGAADADSWATDGHKWLNVPYDCGYAFVRHPEHHRAAMEHRASYLVHGSDVRDPLDWTPEHSRRARGFATYAAIRQLGRDGVAALVAGCCEQAHALATRLALLPDVELIAEPVINQGLVRFRAPGAAADAADHDRWTDSVIREINATGEAYFTGTTWRSMRCMRVSVSNWRTTGQDVERTVAAAAGVLARLRAAGVTPPVASATGA